MDGMLPPRSRSNTQGRFNAPPGNYGRGQASPPPASSAGDIASRYKKPVHAPVDYNVYPEQPKDTAHTQLSELPDGYFNEPVNEPVLQQAKQSSNKGAKVLVSLMMLATIGGVAGGLYKFVFHKSVDQSAAVASTGGKTLGVTSAEPEPQQVTDQRKAATAQKASVELATDAEMATAINAVIAANPSFSIAVSVVPLKGGTAANFGLDAVFDASGTGSLVTAAAYFKQAEAGSQGIDKMIGGKTAGEQLELAIRGGNADAWNAVMNDLGKPALQTFAQSIGMATYTAANNRMKPQDLSTLLKQIYDGTLLSANKNKLLEDMQKSNQTEYIVQTLSSNTGLKIYHRAGSQKDRSQDAAIIDNGTNPYALVVYVKGADAAAESQRVSIIQKITNATAARYIDKKLQTP